MKRFSTFLLASLLVCAGCDQKQSNQESQSPPPGRARETWQFWEAFNEAAVSGVGAEVLKQDAWQQGVETKDVCAVLEDVIATEQARSKAITRLPVLHVDPDATAYAVDFAKARIEATSMLQDISVLLQKQEEITSLPTLGVGLLANLLSHWDDKEDGILWRALLDQGKQTTADLQRLREPARDLEQKIASLRTKAAQLVGEEMAVRVKLAQRFNKEFLPGENYVKAAASSQTQTPLRKEQIIQTIIGQKIGDPPNRWTFDSPQEFVSFKVTAVTNRTSVLTDYFVQTHVKGIPSGREHDFKLRITYGRLYTRWKLVEVKLLP